MKRVTRYIIVMRQKDPKDPSRPAGRRLYVDEGATTTARHRATLFQDYELDSELSSWRAALSDRIFSFDTEPVQVPAGARSLGRAPSES